MQANKLPVLNTHLHMRQAYNAMFLRRLSLYELDPQEVNGLQQAIDNASALTAEVIELLRAEQAAA